MIDPRRIEYALWAEDRPTFVATMQALTNPVTGTPLMDEDETPSRWVVIDEIGPVVKTRGTYDEQGNEITAPVIVSGHHVNMYAVGELAGMLLADPMNALLGLLGTTEFKPSQVGEFAGYVGTSGVKVNLKSYTDAQGSVTQTSVIDAPFRKMA